MNSNANNVQYGGTHYKSTYQHWDLVADIGLDYFSGAASKYVSRWRKKGGIEDLKKAAHFIEKLIELRDAGKILGPDDSSRSKECANRFSSENGLDMSESQIVMLLCTWRARDTAALQSALNGVRWLIRKETETTGLPIDQSWVKPTGWVGYVYEGSSGPNDFYQCKQCLDHFGVPVGSAPRFAHTCGAEPTSGYVNQG